MPNLQRQLPTLADKFWNLLKTSIGGFLGVTGFLLSLVMVPIYLFFFLKERPAIQRRWKEYLPLRNSPLKDEVATILTQINSYLIAYFRGQLLVCLIDGLLIGTALLLLGLNFAPLIGLLVVILTMIPYIGIVLCWVPAVLIATDGRAPHRAAVRRRHCGRPRRTPASACPGCGCRRRSNTSDTSWSDAAGRTSRRTRPPPPVDHRPATR